jgi:uncharacterized protein YoaH (UPF0181 family)
VVQTAAKLLLEPIFEADFDPSAYGYRPKRSARDAVEKVHELMCEGYTDRAVDNYVYDRVRHFLRRRHKLPTRGTRRYPCSWTFGELGVQSSRPLNVGRLA